MTNLQDKMDKSFKELSKSKVERYEKAAITYILKHLGVKKPIPDDPGTTWLMDEVPEWIPTLGVIATRVEHNWIEFFKPREYMYMHPVERLYASRLAPFQLANGDYSDLIIIFKWMPEKFMVLHRDSGPIASAPCLRTSQGYLVSTLQDYLDYQLPK